MSSQCMSSVHQRYMRKNQKEEYSVLSRPISRRLHSTNPSESYSSFDDSYMSSSSDSSGCLSSFNKTMGKSQYNHSYFRGSTDSGLETGSTGSISSSCGKVSPSEEESCNKIQSRDSGYPRYSNCCELPSFNSGKSPLGPRPLCIGQESSPRRQVIRTPGHSRLSNLGSTFTCSAESSELDLEWDNSSLDASCTTCTFDRSYIPDEPTTSSFKQTQFVNHIQSCRECLCTDGLCSVAAVLEQELSSIFEVQDTRCFQPEMSRQNASSYLTNNTTTHNVNSTTFWSNTTRSKCHVRYTSACCDSVVDGSTSYTTYCSSDVSSMKETTLNTTCDRSLAITVTSDMTDFMEKPISKPAVSQPKISKDRKKVLKRKLKTIGKYFQKVRGSGGKDTDIVHSNDKSHGQFTTLAVL